METDLVKLIRKVQQKHGEDSFEISNNTLSTLMQDTIEIKEVYDEGDLTKNYVKFATDLLSGKFGTEFIEQIIGGFGETLKTEMKDFKESYKKKQSSIKEILPSVFIHTSMSKVLMESMIATLVHNARLEVKFHNKKPETLKWTEDSLRQEALKYKSMSDFSKEEPDAYRAVVRHGMKIGLALEMKKKSNFFQNKK
jgi:hypothetical protein